MSTRKENMTTKKCSRCKTHKPLDDFYNEKNRKHGKSSRCKSCASEYQKIRLMDPKIRQHKKEQITRYMREWRKDPHNYAGDRLRSRNSMFLKRLINNFDSVKEETVKKLFHIDKQGFKDHLESLFEPGMSWKNYGAWHLDHKTNLSVFNFLDPKVIEKANHYTNIRPMWATGPKGNLTRKKPFRIKV
jgi:hypothetical protein